MMFLDAAVRGPRSVSEQVVRVLCVLDCAGAFGYDEAGWDFCFSFMIIEQQIWYCDDTRFP